MRRLTSVLAIAGAVLLASLGVSGCATASAASALGITSAYVPMHTSVGGTVQLRAPGARHAGVVSMHTVADIPIPANSLIRFNPDSYHLLITGAGTMHDGKDIMLQLTFANAGTITVIALVTNPESGGSSYFLN